MIFVGPFQLSIFSDHIIQCSVRLSYQAKACWFWFQNFYLSTHALACSSTFTTLNYSTFSTCSMLVQIIKVFLLLLKLKSTLFHIMISWSAAELTECIFMAYRKQSLKMHHKIFPFRNLVTSELYVMPEYTKKHQHLCKLLVWCCWDQMLYWSLRQDANPFNPEQQVSPSPHFEVSPVRLLRTDLIDSV